MDTSNRKILFVINTLSVGGAAKMLKFVVHSIKDFFENIEVVTIFDSQQDYDECSTINLGIDSNEFMWRLHAIKSLRKIIKEKKPKCVCAFVSDVAVLARFATVGTHILFASAERGDPYTQPLIWNVLVKLTYASSNYCFFQLDRAKKYYSKKIQNKSFVIPNPYIPKHRNIKSGMKRNEVAAAGRFAQEKGFDVLLHAFSRVHKEHSDYSLVIYGKGELENKYLDIIKEENLEGCVRFPGYVDDVQDAVKDSKVFVLSSRFEGIPNSLIEAMAAGVPCVATDCSPGGPEFLSNFGERAILVPVDDVEKMAIAINTIIEDDGLANRLSQKAKEITALLDAKDISSRWVEAFSTILNDKI